MLSSYLNASSSASLTDEWSLPSVATVIDTYPKVDALSLSLNGVNETLHPSDRYCLLCWLLIHRADIHDEALLFPIIMIGCGNAKSPPFTGTPVKLGLLSAGIIAQKTLESWVLSTIFQFHYTWLVLTLTFFSHAIPSLHSRELITTDHMDVIHTAFIASKLWFFDMDPMLSLCY